MRIEELVQSVLASNSGVLALVTADNIKSPGEWQNLTLPYITHLAVAPDPTYTMEGRAALTCWNNYQISCFGSPYSSALAVAWAVVDALSGQHGGATFFWKDRDRGYEEDVRIQHVVLDFEVYEAL